jgi:hypothetical protein
MIVCLGGRRGHVRRYWKLAGAMGPGRSYSGSISDACLCIYCLLVSELQLR